MGDQERLFEEVAFARAWNAVRRLGQEETEEMCFEHSQDSPWSLPELTVGVCVAESPKVKGP